jgi:WD40 repeat protein
VDQPAGLWQLQAIQFQRDSSALDVALGDGNVIHFDGLTGKEERRFLADWRSADQRRLNRPGRPDLWEGAFSADGSILVSSADEWVYIWDVKAGKLRHKIRHPHEHGCWLALSSDARTLATSDISYAGDWGQDTIRLFDIDSGEQVLTLDPIDDRASVLVFSPDGTKLFTGFHRGSAIIWDVRRGKRASDTKK